MSRRDSQLLFSDAQAITANATTVVSESVVDLGAQYDHTGTILAQFGPEGGPRLVVTIDTKPTAGTALYLELQDCATADGTYKPTGIGIDSANAIPIATLVAGYEIINVPLPHSLRRFLTVLYTTTGDHSASVGTVNAGIQMGAPTQNTAPVRV